MHDQEMREEVKVQVKVMCFFFLSSTNTSTLSLLRKKLKPKGKHLYRSTLFALKQHNVTTLASSNR